MEVGGCKFETQGTDGRSGVIEHGRARRRTSNKAAAAVAIRKKCEESDPNIEGNSSFRDIGVATPKLIHTPNGTRTEKGSSTRVGVGLQNPFEPQNSRVMTEGTASADSIGMFSLSFLPCSCPRLCQQRISGCRALPPSARSTRNLGSNPRNDFRFVQARSTRARFGISCFRPVSHADRSSCLSSGPQPEPSFSHVGALHIVCQLPAATTTNMSVQQPAQRGVSYAILLVIRSSLPLHFPGRSGSYPHPRPETDPGSYSSRVMDVFVLAGPTTSSKIDRPTGNTFLSAYDSMSRGEK
jgi:hypothetical protein